jgi:hypothetical protein
LLYENILLYIGFSMKPSHQAANQQPQPLVTPEWLATRWACNPRALLYRVKVLGIRPVKLGHKTRRYRLKDVLKAEEIAP